MSPSVYAAKPDHVIRCQSLQRNDDNVCKLWCDSGARVLRYPVPSAPLVPANAGPAISGT
jgi:hypothetical protein